MNELDLAAIVDDVAGQADAFDGMYVRVVPEATARELALANDELCRRGSRGLVVREVTIR